MRRAATDARGTRAGRRSRGENTWWNKGYEWQELARTAVILVVSAVVGVVLRLVLSPDAWSWWLVPGVLLVGAVVWAVRARRLFEYGKAAGARAPRAAATVDSAGEAAAGSAAQGGQHDVVDD